METALGWITQYGATALFFCMMFGIIGLPIPDETLLVFSGYLIHKGTLHPVWTFSMALAGSMCGITVSYLLGHVYGLKLIHKYGRYFHFTEARFRKVHNWFERFGGWSLFFGYYVAGVRHFTAMFAGASGLEFRAFATYAYLGSLTWVLAFLSVGYIIGDQWQEASEQLHRYIVIASLALGVMLGIYLLVRWARKRS
jgi:membrane protein DedA with SNARE-associated domain